MANKIVQIIPAEGWFGVFREEGEEEQLEAVVCFALVESAVDEAPSVIPMCWLDGEVRLCDEVEGFAGVVRSDEIEDD